VKIFVRDGIRLEYPGDWVIQTEPNEDSGWTVTINSPDIAFALISLLPDVSDPEHVANEAVASLLTDYPQLEKQEFSGSVANHPAVGYDIDFFSLDQMAFAAIRVIDTVHGTLLVLLQSTEDDRSWNGPLLIDILKSIRVDE
jgi:hypothetical protein